MPIVDASVYVAVVNRRDAHHDSARRWIEFALRDGQRLLAPNVLLSEAAAAISRGVNDVELALAVTAVLARSLTVELVPIAPTLAQAAAEIAARQRIRGCDALYVALAKALDEPLVTLDRQQLERARAVITVTSP